MRLVVGLGADRQLLQGGGQLGVVGRYAVPLVNAGLLYVGGNQELGNITAHPEPAFPTYIEPTYAPGDGSPKHVVAWANVGGAGERKAQPFTNDLVVVDDHRGDFVRHQNCNPTLKAVKAVKAVHDECCRAPVKTRFP